MASLLTVSPAVAATVTVTDWPSLQAAMLVDGDTVVLGADITAPADERLQLEPGESVTLDLSGRALAIATSIDDQSAFRVPETSSVTIVDSIGTGELTTQSGRNAAGLGGDAFDTAGSITINGGAVTSVGGINAAGIGGGSGFGGDPSDGGGGVVTINGGTVTATAGWNAAGIGGGDRAKGGVVTINAGTVIATGGGLNGPGIGAGTRGGDIGTVTVNGGTLTALGGSGAAGIGRGFLIDFDFVDEGGSVTITGGTVVATGGAGASGIGGGRGDATPGVQVSISGGLVTATGGSSSGAGGGAGIGAKGSLSATPELGSALVLGTVLGPLGTGASGATGSDPTAAPGAGVSFSSAPSAGRYVTVTTTDGAPPDSGTGGRVVIAYAFDVTLDSANGTGPASVRVDAETTLAEPADPIREGFAFDGWRVGSATGPVFDFTTPVSGPITLVAAWRPILADTGVDAQPWLGAALCLMLLGGALLAIARRRLA
jgi:uncharacterized repeat protein (TIGR02543 family)